MVSPNLKGWDPTIILDLGVMPKQVYRRGYNTYIITRSELGLLFDH